jgi:hypothetical protein
MDKWMMMIHSFSSETENMFLQWAFKFGGQQQNLGHLRGCVLKVKIDVTYMQRTYVVLCMYVLLWAFGEFRF